ncbi:uncharacterized protein LOC128966040 [Oppia nitens]|uniref:uncharacterized protein LOC128966040 n=1 Tax=Oppia nitens TaxID=1686743 RepID=UPI0023D98860|nr:uncharacterized protein LOC128966040 [Oppia nitens]
MSLVNERSVFANLNARSELELLDNIYDRIIITDNSANILNILAESSAINPDEDIIRKRGRRKTPKLSQLPLRRSPRKAPSSIGYQRSAAAASVSMDLSTDETASTTTATASHDYFLRTPKKTPTKSLFSRTPRKTPSKSAGSAAVNTPSKLRVSPRKRLQLDGDDSGIGLTPTYLSPDYLQDITTPSTSGYKSSKSSAASANTTTVQKSKSGSKSASVISRRRRRRYF